MLCVAQSEVGPKLPCQAATAGLTIVAGTKLAQRQCFWLSAVQQISNKGRLGWCKSIAACAWGTLIRKAVPAGKQQAFNARLWLLKKLCTGQCFLVSGADIESCSLCRHTLRIATGTPFRVDSAATSEHGNEAKGGPLNGEQVSTCSSKCCTELCVSYISSSDCKLVKLHRGGQSVWKLCQHASFFFPFDRHLAPGVCQHHHPQVLEVL